MVTKRVNLVINGRFLTQKITGVQRYAHELVMALDLLLDDWPGIETTLMSPILDAAPHTYRNIKHQPVGRLRGHLWEQLELPFFAKGATLFCPGNTAPILSLLGKDCTTVTIHDLSYLYFPDAYSRAFRLAYNFLIPLILRTANNVITVSDSEKRSILKHYPNSIRNLHSIQNGGLPDLSEPTSIMSEVAPYVLYVGSLSKRKNFQGMLEVARLLARKRGIRFVFIGSVPDGLTNSEISIENEIKDQIQFLGQIDSWELLNKYYSQASCFFFPSFYEASPLPPIEAMGCGCPVVAASIPSLVERCGEAALYCDPSSVESMCAAVERVLDEPALSNHLRKLGYEQSKKYSWKCCAEKTFQIVVGQKVPLEPTNR